MAYDQASFLAGVAVGRNLKSYPSLMRNRAESIFAFTVGAGSTEQWQFDFTLDFWGEIFWGDGSSEVIDPPAFGYSNLVTLSHVYQGAMTYRIMLIGTINNLGNPFGLGGGGPKTKVISIDTPYPLLRGMGSAANSPRDADAFLCVAMTKLERVASGLLSNWATPGVYESGNSIFTNCPTLEQIPAGLFDRIEYGHIPGTIARERLYQSFQNCSSLQIIPHGLLDNPSLSIVKEMQSIFSGCTGITQIPHGLLDQMTGLELVAGAFRNMGLTDIPPDLFDHCPNITGFQYTFADNAGITGNLPDLWTQYPNADGTGCFRGCTNAANYGSVPNAWK